MKNLQSPIFIETPRLVLRAWQGDDLAAFATINQDEQVTQYLLRSLSTAETELFMQKYNEHIQRHGFGLFACVLKTTNDLLGYVGLNIPDFHTHFTPCVEIGWRLAAAQWGKGYATEAARACLELGFNKFKLNEIVAFTVPANIRSRRVMEKLGMQHQVIDNFRHPNITAEHPLSEHVLYRLRNANVK